MNARVIAIVVVVLVVLVVILGVTVSGTGNCCDLN